MSAIVQSCLQYDIVGYRFNRIDIKLQQWWINMNYGILKYFPRDYFFYKKSNMPYSVIEGTEHKHTSVHHTCSRFKDNKKYNLTCSNMMLRPFLHYSKYQTKLKFNYISKSRYYSDNALYDIRKLKNINFSKS